MTTKTSPQSRIRLALVVAGIAIASTLGTASASFAGQCPAGKEATNGQSQGPAAHSKVSEKVLSMIPLATEMVGLEEHSLRMRRLVVEPGGVVAWHSHADRPAIIYVVSGAITEYATTCSVPIVHKAGDVSTESGGLSHWWKNHTQQPAVLLSADLLHDHKDHNM